MPHIDYGGALDFSFAPVCGRRLQLRDAVGGLEQKDWLVNANLAEHFAWLRSLLSFALVLGGIAAMWFGYRLFSTQAGKVKRKSISRERT